MHDNRPMETYCSYTFLREEVVNCSVLLIQFLLICDVLEVTHLYTLLLAICGTSCEYLAE